MADKNTTIWTSDFLLLCTSYLLMASAFYFLLPTLPIYVVEVLGEDKGKIGLINGVYAVSALIIRFFSGYALDVYGRKLIFIGALIVYVLFSGAYFIASSFFILLVIRFFHGLSWGVITTGGGTVAADLIPSEKRGEGLGYFGLTITLAMALGPVVGLWIIEKGNFNYLFLGALILALAAQLIATKINYKDIRLKHEANLRFTDFIEIRVLHIAVVMLFGAFAYAGIISFVTLYGGQLQIKNAGYFFLIYALGITILRPFAGKFMDQHGPRLLMPTSLTITIVGIFMLSFAHDIYVFLFSAFIIGLGNGIIMPTIQAMIINVVEPERRGIANSTLYSAIDLGIALGSILLGYISEMTSIANMYFVCGWILLFPLCYFLVITLKDYNKKVKLIKE